MPNYLEDSIGNTGTFIGTLSQVEFQKRLLLGKGACVAICAKFMCEISQKRLPKLQDSIEVAQWLHEKGKLTERLQMLTDHYGLKAKGGVMGKLTEDATRFLEHTQKVGKLPSFNMFGVDNTDETEGHELLIFTENGTKWLLLDPNFGIASWPNFTGMIGGLKRLLKSGQYEVWFGPDYPFSTIKYEWA